MKKHQIKQELKILSEKKGRATELISVYIPPNKVISDVTKHMKQEYGQSANIKSKQTRKNVQSAIDTVVQRLKLFNKPPENGLVLFVGVIDKMEVHLIEPIEPIKTYTYHCDSRFYLSPLEDLMEDKDVYGIVIIERNEATIARIKGKNIQILKHLTGDVPGKTTKGGQSQARYARLVEERATEFLKRIAKHMNNIYLGMDLKGIVIGGPGFTKQDFIDANYLDYRLKELILGTVDVCYTGEVGIREVLDKSKDMLSDIDIVQEKKLLQKFFERISKNIQVNYGLDPVLKSVTNGSVETLLLSEDLDFPDFIELAEDMGTDVEIISLDTDEGVQFRRAFGGIGAMLRYEEE